MHALHPSQNVGVPLASISSPKRSLTAKIQPIFNKLPIRNEIIENVLSETHHEVAREYEIRDVWEKGYKRIVAIGDVHGGFDELKGLLFSQGIIDSSNNWSIKDTIIVQVGDLIDRGTQNMEVLDFFIHLVETAEDDGRHNKVFVLRGESLFERHRLLSLYAPVLLAC